MKCPNCGFDHGEASFGDDLADIRLPRLQRRILARLISARGGVVSMPKLIDACYGERHDGGPDVARACVYSYLNKLGRKVSSSGYKVENRHSEGYRLARIDAPGGAP